MALTPPTDQPMIAVVQSPEMMMTRTMLSLCCLISLLVLSTPSWAQTTEEQARASFQLGVELYNEGKFDQAAIAFGRAYELKPSFKLLYNIAQTHNEMGHYAAALQAYVRYLAEGDAEIPVERRERVRAEIKRLNSLVGSLTVTTAIAGATVFLDDSRQGDTPLPAPLFMDIGEHVIVLKRGGDELHREKVTIGGGSRVELKIDAGSAPLSAKPVQSEQTAQDGEPSTTASVSDPERRWAWVAFGVGGAGVVGAAIAGGLTIAASKDLEESCDGDNCPLSKQETIDRGERAALATDLLIGVAAVGLVAGVVLYFTEPGLNGTELQVAPTVTAAGGGLHLSGRF